jgi:cholesterol 7-dehydrogenase
MLVNLKDFFSGVASLGGCGYGDSSSSTSCSFGSCWSALKALSFNELLFGCILIGVLFKMIYWSFSELHLVKDAKKSFTTESSTSKFRKIGEIPPVYANGWYKLIDSNALKKKESKFVEAFNEHFVVFRGENGKVAVLDAYCPHLGANLADGKVIGNCIECPFHQWKFCGDGTCSEVPYATVTPSFITNKTAIVKTWPVVEVNGMICIFYHAEGKEPTFELEKYSPDLKEFRYHGKISHVVKSHMQDIAENGSDVAHLGVIHGRTGPFIRHEWTGTWEAGTGEKGHMGFIEQEIRTVVFGIEFPGSNIGIKTYQTGPAIVYVHWTTAFGKIILIHSVTPIGPLLLRVEHLIYSQWTIPRPLAKLFLLATALQFEGDSYVWNAKIYRSKPLLVKGDGKILQFRRWYSQFYSEHSPTFQSIQEKKKL